MDIASVRLGAGLTISYREAGSENPVAVVQIHGLGTGHQNFDLLTPHLSKSLHTYDIDLPGYGKSACASAERGITYFAESVAQFIEALELGPVHLHGTSMGGSVAIVLATQRPELIDRLVISCSFARFDRASHFMFKTWRMAAANGIEELALVTSHQGFSRSFWDRPESDSTVDAFVAALQGMTPTEFLRDLELIENLDISVAAADIRASTLLLGADEDIMTPMQSAPSGLGMTDLHKLIPESNLEILDNCGHFISVERPAETAQAIADFLLVTE
jgi:pimeloyl-ACP methyl ester carboxylesterase